MTELNLIHQVRAPLNSPGPAPAVVLVHGWLGTERVMWAFERALPPEAWAISVRAPFEAEGGYGWMISGDEDSFEKGLAALTAFVEQLPQALAVDPRKMIVMGFSQGAALAYALLLAHPHLCNGVAALAGFVPAPAQPWATPGRLQGKPVFIAHGTQDPTVPLADADLAQTLMQASGATVTYVTDPTGHKVGAQGMRALKAWLSDCLGQDSLTNS